MTAEAQPTPKAKPRKKPITADQVNPIRFRVYRLDEAAARAYRPAPAQGSVHGRSCRSGNGGVRLGEDFEGVLDGVAETPACGKDDYDPSGGDKKRRCSFGGFSVIHLYFPRGRSGEGSDELVGCADGLEMIRAFEPEAFADGAHEQVGDEADYKETAHDVEDERVGVFFGHLVGYVVVEDAVDNERADDAGGGPGGEQTAVDGRDVEAAEEVFEVGGDGGEAAAVHGDDDGGDGDEEGTELRWAARVRGRKKKRSAPRVKKMA